jgi:hypothetical protein
MFLSKHPKVLPVVLVTAILSVGIFGFLSMGLMSHVGQPTCPISILSGGGCPPADSSLALANHYISGLQYVSQAIVSTGVLLLLSFLILRILLLVARSLILEKYRTRISDTIVRYYVDSESDFIQSIKLLRWIALHNKRDPHARQWAHDRT